MHPRESTTVPGQFLVVVHRVDHTSVEGQARIVGTDDRVVRRALIECLLPSESGAELAGDHEAIRQFARPPDPDLVQSSGLGKAAVDVPRPQD
jgi:hypothetical protein